MKEVDYQIRINSLINKLPPEKLREKLLSIAYNVPSERWDEFISYFDGDDLKDGIEDIEVLVIDDDFDKALIFLDEVIEEEIYLTKVYKRSSDIVDDCQIEDSFNIEEQMHGVFLLVDRFLEDKEYSKALSIYSKLKDLYIPVQDDEYEMLSYSLEEYYSDSNKYEEDIAYIGSRALFCIYSLSGNLDIRVKKFNDYLNSPLCRSVTAENFIKESKEDYKNLEAFLLKLLPILFETAGSKSIEWIHSVAPINLLSTNIEKYHKLHPRLFRILMQKCIANKQYKEAFEVGRKAINMMDITLIERSKAANLLLSISLYLRGIIDEDDIDAYYYTASVFKLEKNEILYLFDRFESRSTMNNFLSLYRNISENVLLKNRLIGFLIDYKNNLVNEDEDNEFITNIINRDVIALASFLLNPCLKSLSELKIRYSSYDKEYKNGMVNMFLLFLSQVDGESSYLSSIAPNKNEIGYTSSLYVKFDLKLSSELMNGVLDWIGDTVFRSVGAMLEKEEKKYYLRTAKIIKAVNNLLLKYDIPYMDSSAIDYYSKEYCNVHEFIKVLNSVR
jgi:hypothetical protein